MAVVFLDTSALVRRYDAAEPGSGRVRTICERPAGQVLLIARVTPVEVGSALNRELRERRFDRSGRDRRWRLFRLHLRRQYRVVALDEQIHQLAERLVFDHPPRAYDALQVAAALRAARLVGDLTADFRFCTSDRIQAEAASAEGLMVELIS